MASFWFNLHENDYPLVTGLVLGCRTIKPQGGDVGEIPGRFSGYSGRV
jgi:hypothetical protein